MDHTRAISMSLSSLPGEPALETDRQILVAVQAGQVARFDEIANRYARRLLAAARSRFPDEATAQDAVQETLLAAYASRHTYNPRFAVSTWIWTIFLNHCSRRSARDRREQALLQDVHLKALPRDNHSGVLADLLRAETAAQLHAALETLPDVEADTLRLRFFGELTFEEIAQTMACSIGGAKMRVKRGLQRLARHWNERMADQETGR